VVHSNSSLDYQIEKLPKNLGNDLVIAVDGVMIRYRVGVFGLKWDDANTPTVLVMGGAYVRKEVQVFCRHLLHPFTKKLHWKKIWQVEKSMYAGRLCWSRDRRALHETLETVARNQGIMFSVSLLDRLMSPIEERICEIHKAHNISSSFNEQLRVG
jgi:hypothetical protein